MPCPYRDKVHHVSGTAPYAWSLPCSPFKCVSRNMHLAHTGALWYGTKTALPLREQVHHVSGTAPYPWSLPCCILKCFSRSINLPHTSALWYGKKNCLAPTRMKYTMCIGHYTVPLNFFSRNVHKFAPYRCTLIWEKKSALPLQVQSTPCLSGTALLSASRVAHSLPRSSFCYPTP